jgi:hypothetical protein
VRTFQAVFDNPYTRRDRLVRPPMRAVLPGRRTPTKGRRRSGRAGRRPGAFATLALLAPTLLLASVLTVSAAGGWSAPGTGAPPSYDSGQFSAFFPSPAPEVELLQDANSSVAAELFLDHVLEIEPGNSDHPIVVQVASPTSATPFSGSFAAPGESSFSLDLQGTVPVVRTGVPLWTTPLGLPSNVSGGPGFLPVTGGATLSVAYTVAPGAGGAPGLELRFNIHGWPWLAPGDLLGVELRFVENSAIGFDACGPLAALNGTPGAGCNGTVLAPGGILWNARGSASVVPRDAGGLAAAFEWGPTAELAAGASAPVVSGAYFASANTTRVMIAVAAAGATNVTTTARMLIAVPPAVGAGLATLHGELAPYLLTAAGAATVAIVAIERYRRRDRRLRDEL